jgi:V/A-type H+-transporting ATPase subunit K
MFTMFGEKVMGAPQAGLPCLVIGLFAGLGICFSAVMQGRCAAAAADAQGETGKGFTNYLAAIGIIETVAIFTMAVALIGVLKFSSISA